MITTGDLIELTKVGLKGGKKMAKKQSAPTYSPERVAQVKRAASAAGVKPSTLLGSVAQDSAQRTATGRPLPAVNAGSKSHLASGQATLNTGTGSTIPNGTPDPTDYASPLGRKNANDPRFHRFVEKVSK